MNQIATVEQSITSPLDLTPEVFQEGLDRRKENRESLMGWVKKSLVENTDFGSIMIKGRKSKPSLLKPGSEKICGMLGLTPTFPNLNEYEQQAVNGGTIDQMIIRCELVANGVVVATGAGGRSLKQDGGDINKALKMCLKSAQIDATLRCAGLSEVFTQDIEDMNLGDENKQPHKPSAKQVNFDRDGLVGFGKHKEVKWRDVDSTYLDWIIEKMDKDFYVDCATQEKEARKKARDEKPVEDSQIPPESKEISTGPKRELLMNKLKVTATAFWTEEKWDGELHIAVQKKFGVKKVEELSDDQVQTVITGLTEKMA